MQALPVHHHAAGDRPLRDAARGCQRRSGDGRTRAAAIVAEHPVDGLQERIELEGLLEKVGGAEADRVHRRLDRPVPRDHDDRDARHLLAHALHQLDAVHLGHPDVHDGEPGHRVVERGERRPAVLGLEHLVPLVDEHIAQGLADVRLVVDHQDRLGHVPPPRAPSHPPA